MKKLIIILSILILLSNTTVMGSQEIHRNSAKRPRLKGTSKTTITDIFQDTATLLDGFFGIDRYVPGLEDKNEM